MNLLLGLLLTISSVSYAQMPEYIPVPEGNRNETRPEIEEAAIEQLRETSSNIEKAIEIRFQKAKKTMLSDIDEELPTLTIIKQAAATYGISPVHILGAILGEATYNVGLTDKLQGLIGSVNSWVGNWLLKFESNSIDLTELIQRPEFSNCPAMILSNYYYWNCIQDTWNANYRGKVIDGVKMKSFRSTFFNPSSSGFTYGLGQMDPLRALMVADMVHAQSGLPMIDIDHVGDVYAAIIHPHSNVHYLAANIYMMIEAYKAYAGFDISTNPGITATLYNLGGEMDRAKVLKARNDASTSVIYPQENFYGWLINDKLSEIQEMLTKVPDIAGPPIN